MHAPQLTDQERLTGETFVPRYSEQPFGETVRGLLHAEQLTHRELAARTQKVDGRGLKHPHLTVLINGQAQPSERAMELVAEVFGKQPDFFAEYRLKKAVESLDPERVGLPTALANLRRLRR